MKTKTREHILNHINNNIGWRMKKMEQKLATQGDIDLVNEALGFRSLCLFSCIADIALKKIWNDSNLEYSL